MLKAALTASVLSLATVAGASAASPVSPVTASGILNADRANSAIVDAQYYRHHSTRESRHHSRRHPQRYHSHRYVPGRHYRSAPRGWHRYAARPYNWRTRGCVIVGPVWFCP